MIWPFRPVSDKKFEKSLKALCYLLDETTKIHDVLEKMVGLIEQSRHSLSALTSGLSTSMATQIDLLKKMQSFYDIQIKWANEQRELAEKVIVTEDDKRF